MKLWAHAVDDCTMARNLQPRKDWRNAYEAFGERPPVKSKDLMPWGAKGWMTTKIKAKWQPKAVRVRRVSYAKNTSSDTRRYKADCGESRHQMGRAETFQEAQARVDQAKSEEERASDGAQVIKQSVQQFDCVGFGE